MKNKLSLIMALCALLLCALSSCETHRWVVCMRYALGSVQSAPPDYCFEGDR